MVAGLHSPLKGTRMKAETAIYLTLAIVGWLLLGIVSTISSVLIPHAVYLEGQVTYLVNHAKTCP